MSAQRRWSHSVHVPGQSERRALTPDATPPRRPSGGIAPVCALSWAAERSVPTCTTRGERTVHGAQGWRVDKRVAMACQRTHE